METPSDIFYRLVLFWSGQPLDTLGVVALFALLKVVLFLLKYVGRLLIEMIVVGYVVKMLEIHAWPKLPHGVQLILLKMVDRALLRKPSSARSVPRKDESAFSKNSKRHPHW